MAVIVSAVVAVALDHRRRHMVRHQGGDDTDDQAKDKDKQTSQGSTSGSTGGTKNKPAPKTVNARLINKLPMPKVDDQVTVEGMWTIDDTFVKARVNKIDGYPLDGGTAKWMIPACPCGLLVLGPRLQGRSHGGPLPGDQAHQGRRVPEPATRSPCWT